MVELVHPRPSPDTLPSVSVIVTCYNYGAYVEQAIRSALDQTGVDVDVVAVDDQSTDDSVSLIRRLAAEDSRVRLIDRKSNGGAVVAFNTGLAVARGDYIVRLDADDLLTPGALSRATSLGIALPGVGLIYSHPLHFTDGEPLPRARIKPTRWRVWHGQSWLLGRIRTGLSVITSPEVVIRRSVLDEVGPMRNLEHTHDFELWLRLSAISEVAYIEGADQAWHREHARSLSRSVRSVAHDLRGRREAFDVLFGWADGRIANAPALRDLARHALATEALSDLAAMRRRTAPLNADLEAELIAFAIESDPAVTATAEWKDAARAADEPPVARLLSRARTRIRFELEGRRWSRTGVFRDR